VSTNSGIRRPAKVSSVSCGQRGRQGQRRQGPSGHEDERHRSANRTVVVLQHEVVADGSRRRRQRRDRRHEHRPRLHARGRRERLVERRDPLERRLQVLRLVEQPLVGDVRQEHDVARSGHRFGQRAIRFLPRPFFLADAEPSSIGLGEQDVVDDEPGGGSVQEIDQRGMHQARPRPSPHRRAHAPHTVVVYRDECDLVVNGCRPRRRAEAQVIGLELDGVHERDQREEPGQQAG
jgi:hypothetical protein